MEKSSSQFRLSPEAKVGVFVVVGILILVYMSVRLGGIKLGGGDGYTLKIIFDNASGLDKDASVRVAGVEIGRVKNIYLKDSKAVLELNIQSDVKIGNDFMAVLTTKGLLGERYVELIPGAPNAPTLKDGELIARTTSYADMDKLMTILSDVAVDIKTVTETLSKVLGGKEGETSLKNIVTNIEQITFRLNRLIEKNDAKIDHIVKNIDDFSATLKKDGPVITDEIKLAVRNLNTAIEKTSGNLNGLIDENRGNIKEGVENLRLATMRMQEAMDSINRMAQEISPALTETANSASSIARKLDKGEGTLGKLINDPVIHDNINRTVVGINKYLDKAETMKMFLGYRGEYGVRSEKTKSYFYLRVQPKADKLYMIDIVSDPIHGRRKTETVDTTTGAATTSTRTETTTDSFKISAQIGKRFWNVMLRGGIIESSGGVGADMYMFKDRLRFTLEAFDFSRKGRAHVKAGGTLFFAKYLYLTAGYDDFMSKQYKSSYLGLGLHFEDEDIKYMLGSVPSMSSY